LNLPVEHKMTNATVITPPWLLLPTLVAIAAGGWSRSGTSRRRSRGGRGGGHAADGQEESGGSGRSYRVGAEQFGPEFARPAPQDTARLVRDWANKLLARDKGKPGLEASPGRRPPASSDEEPGAAIMSQDRLPESIRRFVERQTTMPVADLWEVDSKELRSPYGT